MNKDYADKKEKLLTVLAYFILIVVGLAIITGIVLACIHHPPLIAPFAIAISIISVIWAAHWLDQH